MTAIQRWLAAGVWAGSIVIAALYAPDHRWFYAAFAGVAVGVAFAFTARWTATTGARRRRSVAALAALAGGVLAFWANLSAESRCTARNASGQRVVIGTELTARGIQYRDANPTDDKNAMLESLGGLSPGLAWTQSSIDRCRFDLIATGASWIPLFGIALACGIALVTPSKSPLAEGTAPPSAGRKKVFISYNHDDAAIAIALRDALVGNGLEVIIDLNGIDLNGMAAGQRIEEFIAQSVQRADTVVSIVSNRSLLSSWVAMETIKSLRRQEWTNRKLFIACYLSDDYFRPEFRLELTRQIDSRLELIERLIADYAEKKIDSVDLNQEKTRLFDLRNNLGTILAQMKETLCLDLRGAEFDHSVRRLITTIKGT